MTLIWSEGARQDFRLIGIFLKSNNPAIAHSVLDRIEQALEQLESFPQSGRDGRNSRELVIPGTPYIIAYDLTIAGIELLGILHGSRLWPERF